MIHLVHPCIANRCQLADDPRSTVSDDAGDVTCHLCLASIRAHVRATDETLKNAPAVTRRMPAVSL